MRALRLLATAVLTAGILRGAWFHFVAEPIWRFAETREPLIDARYAAARDTLPAYGRVGYRTDAPRGSEAFTRRYTQALYALAPHVLVPDDGTFETVLIDETGSAAARVTRRR